ncbi:MAG: hypothetical protein ACOX2O_03625 [Bdellovibrionota bacterium]|jgi:hypothetical protein
MSARETTRGNKRDTRQPRSEETDISQGRPDLSEAIFGKQGRSFRTQQNNRIDRHKTPHKLGDPSKRSVSKQKGRSQKNFDPDSVKRILAAEKGEQIRKCLNNIKEDEYPFICADMVLSLIIDKGEEDLITKEKMFARYYAAVENKKGAFQTTLSEMFKEMSKIETDPPSNYLKKMQKQFPQTIEIEKKRGVIQGENRSEEEERDTMSSIFMEAIFDASANGSLGKYQHLEPELEEWASKVSSVMISHLYNSESFKNRNINEMVKLFIGSTIILEHYLSPLNLILINGDKEFEGITASILAIPFNNMRCSILSNITREIMSSLSESKDKERFIDFTSKFYRSDLSTYYISPGEYYELTAHFSSFGKIRKYLESILPKADTFTKLNDITRQLQEHPFLDSIKIRLKDLTLPHGEILLRYSQEGHPDLLLHYNTRQNYTDIIIYGNKGFSFQIQTARATHKTYLDNSIDDTLGIRITDNAKIHIGDDDLYSTVPNSAEYLDALETALQIEITGIAIIQRWMRSNPELFCNLNWSNPLLLSIKEGEGAIAITDDELVIKQIPQKNSGCELSDENRSFAKRFGITPLYGTTLEKPQQKPTEEEEPTSPEDQLSDSERIIYREIYKYLPNGKFSWVWFKENLDPSFGELIFDRSGGKGSHSKVYLKKNGEKIGYWTASRKEVRNISHRSRLKEILEGLQISPQEFLESLER